MSTATPPSSLLPSLLPRGSAIGVLLSAPGSVHPCKGSSWVGIEVLSPDTQTQFPTTLPLEPYQMTCSLGNPHSVIDICPSFPVTFNSPLPQHTSNSEKKNILKGISPQCWRGFGSWHPLKTLKTECVDRNVCTLLGRHLHLQHKEGCVEGS